MKKHSRKGQISDSNKDLLSNIELRSVIDSIYQLSEDLKYKDLLTRILKITIMNSGATKAMLINKCNDGYTIEAVTTISGEIYNTVFKESHNVSLPIQTLNYVSNTQKQLTFSKGSTYTETVNDEYFKNEGIQSAICLPLKSVDKQSFLFLENNLIADIFTPNKIEILNLLSKQISISIENAKKNKNLKKEIKKRKLAEDEVKNLNDNLEKRVKQRTEELHQANEEMRAFSYSVSHDLRAPLRSMEGFAQILLEDYLNVLDEEGQDYLKRIQNNAVKMNDLIDELLKLSRVTSKEIEVSECNFSIIAQDVFNEQKELLAINKPVKLSISPNIYVKADEKLLVVALSNLIGNAIKFSQSVDEPHIEIGVKTKNEEEIYYIKDNGIGFDEKYSEKLFQVFQKLHSKEEYSGTGIGLSITQKVITRHKGKIWAKGKPNKGATFYFTLG